MALSVDRGALRRYIERSIQDLPALPAVVSKVIELTERPEATATDLERLINSDPAIASKILRVVNSAFYGLRSQISTVAHATVILGFTQVRNLVLSMAAMSLVKGGGTVGGQVQLAFWKHAFGSGAAATEIGKLKKLSHEECDLVYMGGLLHDLGALFLLSNFSDMYRETLKIAMEEGIPLEQAEYRFLGITHSAVGELLTTAWNFPEPLRLVVGQHHGPFDESPNPCSMVVHAADHLTSVAGYPTVPLPNFEMDPTVSSWLGFTDETMNTVSAVVLERVEGAVEFFHLL